MDLSMIQSLEANGYRVIEKQYMDPHFRTRTFIHTPDGHTYAHYDYLWQVPMNLNDGEEVSVLEIAVPAPARNSQSHELHAQTFGVGTEKKLFGIIMGLIFLGIVLGVLFMRVFFAGDGIAPPPCGVRGSIIEISECVKEVIYPDCSGVMFDSCNNVIIDDFDPPVQPPAEWWVWAVVGIIAIGAIIIVPPLIKSFKKPPEK